MEMIIKTGIREIRLSESKIENLLYDVSCIESILLMLLNDESTWENQQEVEFTRAEAKEFLSIYFAERNYKKEYIKNSLNKLNTMGMTIKEIHKSIEEGKRVYWENALYELKYVNCEENNPSGKFSFKNGKAIRITCTSNGFGSLIGEKDLNNCYLF